MANKLLKTLNFGGNDKYDLAPKWENIQNLPFGYETPTGGDTLKWDGTTSGLTNVLGVLYHVSDAVPTLVEGKIEINSNGTVTTTPFNESDINDMGEGVKNITINSMPMVVIVPSSAVGVTVDGLKFTKQGIYFRNAGGEYVASLTINGYEGFAGIKPIGGAYLPKALQFGTEVTYGEIMSERELVPLEEGAFIALDDNGESPFVLPQLTVGFTYTVVWNGVTYETLCSPFEGVSALGNVGLMTGGDDTGEPFVCVIANMYGSDIVCAMPLDGAETITMSLSGSVETITKLDSKYLPKPFIVNLESEDSLTFTADKTYNDIREAFIIGMRVYAINTQTDEYMQLINLTSYAATFMTATDGSIATFTLYDDGHVNKVVV